MFRVVRRLLLVCVLGASLLAVSGSAALAAPPTNPAGVNVTVCATGDDLTISITWRGELADAWNYGWGNDEGGLGVNEPLAHPSPRGAESHTFAGAAPDATFAGAGLSFRDAAGSSQTIDKPETGWPAC
jgi:hypothetical protein